MFRFQDEEKKLEEHINQLSAKDRPLCDMEDPYSKEEVKCILCPKRYALPIRPDYKNPKLLAQFVSPHTGLVYKKHITGLCEFMQSEVEEEVGRAQALGKFSMLFDIGATQSIHCIYVKFKCFRIDGDQDEGFDLLERPFTLRSYSTHETQSSLTQWSGLSHAIAVGGLIGREVVATVVVVITI